MDAAVAALLGTGIGALSAFGAAWLQQRMQGRREILKLAADVAMRDYERRIEVIRSKGGGPIPPIGVFISYQVELMTAMAAGPVTPEDFRRLRANYEALERAFDGAA